MSLPAHKLAWVVNVLSFSDVRFLLLLLAKFYMKKDFASQSHN